MFNERYSYPEPLDAGTFLTRAVRMDPVSRTERAMKHVHNGAMWRRRELAKVDEALADTLMRLRPAFARMDESFRQWQLEHLAKRAQQAKEEILTSDDPGRAIDKCKYFFEIYRKDQEC